MLPKQKVNCIQAKLLLPFRFFKISNGLLHHLHTISLISCLSTIFNLLLRGC